MDFLTLGRYMPALLDTSLDLDRRISIELMSAPGRGKSEFVRDLVTSQSQRTGENWGLATCFLATQSPSDLLGFMIPERDTKGRARSVFTMPAWYQTTDGGTVEDYPRGILFLDEYGQGESDVKRASAELLLNGRLGPWRLPKGWTVIAASNRAKDRSGVTKSFDFVINRRMEIAISDNLDAWLDWAQKKGVHPILIHFASQNPQIVFSDGVPDKQGPWCTPRSLVMVGNVLEAVRPPSMSDQLLPSDGDAIQLAAGLIGEAATAQLMASIKLAGEMPPFEDIVRDPDGVKVPTKADACYMVVHQVAHRVTRDNIEACLTYLRRMPQEFAFMFAKSVITRQPMLAATPVMASYYKDNATLIAAVTRA